MSEKASFSTVRTQIGTSIALTTCFYSVNYLIVRGEYPHVCNEGIAFGIDLPQPLFIVLWIVTMVFVLRMYLQAKNLPAARYAQWGLLLILAGGVANILDRITHGCVIDYISVVPWNTFNLADASIFIGAVLVLWHSIINAKQKMQSKKDASL